MSGLFAFRVARLNGEVQLKGLREELQQANEQAHRTRLVEARKTYLLEVRDLLGGLFGATMTIPITLAALRPILESGSSLDSESSKVLLRQTEEAGTTLIELPRVYKSMGQVSDKDFTIKVDELFVSLAELNPGMQQLEKIKGPI